MTARSPLPAPEQKRAHVRAMFDRIAPRYDLLNRLMTLGLDSSWRRKLVQALDVGRGELVVDLGAGTGDLAELAAARGARVVAVDLALGMLRAAQRRRPAALLVQADALSLPFPSASVRAITCGFAVRNFSDPQAVFAECARVLEPGGRLGLLEVDEPRSVALRLGHRVYFRHLVPRLGAMLSNREAYAYLPASAEYLPDEAALRALLTSSGFELITKTSHLFGAAQSITAVRTPRVAVA